MIGPGGRVIGIKSAVYDAAARTVTLHPKQRISIHYKYQPDRRLWQTYGLTDAQGRLLDGAADGQPGSDYRGQLTWRNLVLDPPAAKSAHQSKTVTVKLESRLAAAKALRQRRCSQGLLASGGKECSASATGACRGGCERHVRSGRCHEDVDGLFTRGAGQLRANVGGRWPAPRCVDPIRFSAGQDHLQAQGRFNRTWCAL